MRLSSLVADNYYIPGYLKTIEDEIDKGMEIIAYDFLSHHPRRRTNVIEVKLERKFVDLGSFIASAEVIRRWAA